MILTIAIPTIVTRKDKFDKLFDRLVKQIVYFGYGKDVEIISECDNKEISIGKKRDNLIMKAKGEYIVMIDDDDMIAHNYLLVVINKLLNRPDCVGYLEKIKHNNKTSCISLNNPGWIDNYAGYDYARTPFFKVPIKTEICREVGCRDMRFAEDHDFANRVKPFLKTEEFINDYMYIYQYSHEPHNQKYGIR